MEKRPNLSRRDFLKAAGLITGSAVLAACAPYNNVDATHFPTLNPTLTKVADIPVTAMPSPDRDRQIDNLFKLGSFDVSKPFQIVAKEKLRRFMNHTDDLTWIYSQDFPLVVRTANPDDADPNNNFMKSIDDHHLGFYGFVFAANVDKPGETQTVVVYSHDLMENPATKDKPHTATLGSLAFDIAGFADKNPDKVKDLYKQTVTIVYEGHEVEARIANVITLPAIVWDFSGDDTLRTTKNKLGIQAIFTPEIGVFTPTDPNVVQLIVASCQTKNVGVASLWNADNIVNTSYTVLEFERPQ